MGLLCNASKKGLARQCRPQTFYCFSGSNVLNTLIKHSAVILNSEIVLSGLIGTSLLQILKIVVIINHC